MRTFTTFKLSTMISSTSYRVIIITGWLVGWLVGWLNRFIDTWQWVLAITVTSYWARWRLQSPASWLFTQLWVQTHIKENIKARCHCPLWGKFTGDRWIPLTKGRFRGKSFHLMTSSWPRTEAAPGTPSGGFSIWMLCTKPLLVYVHCLSPRW